MAVQTSVYILLGELLMRDKGLAICQVSTKSSSDMHSFLNEPKIILAHDLNEGKQNTPY